MNPIYIILWMLMIVLAIFGLIKLFSGSILLGLGCFVGVFILGTIGGLLTNGGKWK